MPPEESSSTITFSDGTLLLTGFSREGLERVFPGIPWTWDPRISGWRTDGFCYPRVLEGLERFAGEMDDQVGQWESVEWPDRSLPELRDEQLQAVDAWWPAKRGCIVMPTGTGKTVVALSIMSRLKCSTLIVAPVRDLMYQWHRRIKESLGYDAGIIGDSVFRVRPVSVTTYDSAGIHMNRLGNRFRLIVFDECHHLPGRSRREAALMCAAPCRLGLTATLTRSDGRHEDLVTLVGATCFENRISDAKGRTLADYEVIRIPVHLSDEERARYQNLSAHVRDYMVKRREEDPEFRWEDLCADAGTTPEARHALRAYRMKQSIEDRATEKLRLLEDVFRLHAGQPCIVFAGSNAMARDVSRRFLIPCLLSHCGKKERIDILEGLQDGRYPALVANQILDEGVDMPAVNVAIVIGGSSSTRHAKQRLGRILRKSGNAKATLYEIVTAETTEVARSRKRRETDAYEGTRHRRI